MRRGEKFFKIASFLIFVGEHHFAQKNNPEVKHQKLAVTGHNATYPGQKQELTVSRNLGPRRRPVSSPAFENRL